MGWEPHKRFVVESRTVQPWAARSRDDHQRKPAASAWHLRRGLARVLLPESPLPRYENFQHVRNQRRRIDSLPVDLCVKCGVAVEVGFQTVHFHRALLPLRR